MFDLLEAAVRLTFQPQVLLIILGAAAYGIFVGSIPGLTATMAVALMVPLTFFLSDVQAIAAIVTTVTCSIFAGDIPATLVRIPGTPASAAYANDAYALRQAGRHERTLGVALVFSVIGGLFGAIVLLSAAPQLAKFAAKFSQYENFWLYVLGLTCAAVVSDESRLKGAFSLLVGLLLSTVGLGTDFSVPRLTFGSDQLITGINFIPAMIGLFGISEVLRNVLFMGRGHTDAPLALQALKQGSLWSRSVWQPIRRLLEGACSLAWQRKVHLFRSSLIGALVGMLPGAGADIAAWISYAVSKRFSRNPQQYGKGSLEAIGDATGANNAALAGAWIPALVFGIPGDSVTAIAIGVLLMKDITPGPQIFDSARDFEQTVLVYSIYVIFVVANLILLPVGLAAIRGSTLLIRIPRRILLPIILLFCLVGAFALDASYFDVTVMLAMGLLGFVFELYAVPLGPIVLGIILGNQLEHRFIQCITRSSSVTAFFSSPISLALAAASLALWLAPVLLSLRRSRGSENHSG